MMVMPLACEEGSLREVGRGRGLLLLLLARDSLFLGDELVADAVIDDQIGRVGLEVLLMAWVGVRRGGGGSGRVRRRTREALWNGGLLMLLQKLLLLLEPHIGGGRLPVVWNRKYCILEKQQLFVHPRRRDTHSEKLGRKNMGCNLPEEGESEAVGAVGTRDRGTQSKKNRPEDRRTRRHDGIPPAWRIREEG